MDYGKRLKELRTKAGLSANALAKQVDLDPTTIYKIEGGTSKPSLDSLERICEIVGVTMAEFFFEKNVNFEIDLDKLKSLSGKIGKANNSSLAIKLANYSNADRIVKNKLLQMQDEFIDKNEDDMANEVKDLLTKTFNEQVERLSQVYENVMLEQNGTYTFISINNLNSEIEELTTQYYNTSTQNRELIRKFVKFLQESK